MSSTEPEKDRTALLIIKMQNDFVFDGGSNPVKGAVDIIDPIAKLAKRVRKENGMVIYMREVHEKGDSVFKNGHEYALKETIGAEVVEDLDPEPGDYILDFKRISIFKGTSIENILKEERVNHLIIVGLCTEGTVHYSAAEAAMLGFAVEVPEKAVIASNPELGKWALKMLKDIVFPGTNWHGAAKR
ncbi:MAG: cysteine hydrolase [Deltaproteobacteria bacterium]|nr:cysteine hydrolase [Deltaproteobacteria bacterium]